MQQYVNDTSHNLDLRVAELVDDIGTKPFQLDAKYDAPNLWGTIAQISDDMGQDISLRGNFFVDEQMLKAGLLKQQIELRQELNGMIDPVHLKSNSIKSSLLTIGKSLKSK